MIKPFPYQGVVSRHARCLAIYKVSSQKSSDLSTASRAKKKQVRSL